MGSIGRFGYHPVEFTKDGSVFDGRQTAALLQSLRNDRVTDLYVASHGWNSDKVDADKLYRDLFGRVSEQSATNPRIGAPASWACSGPSIHFDDGDLIPGAANRDEARPGWAMPTRGPTN